MIDPEVGDWVQVYGQRVATPYSSEHPEEWVIRIQSHNADQDVLVRRDWTVKCHPPKGIAVRCTHLYEVTDSQGYVLKRCTLHQQHNGNHEATIGGVRGTWENSDSVGYFEER